MRNCDDKKILTTNQGVPIKDNKNSLTVGDRGPGLIQDVELIEKLASFNRERIPERVVHAKGAGAKGYFQVYECMSQYTMAKFLQNPKEKTPIFVRFSTVIGSKGSADTARDPRGFAVKFYTQDGNYDLVGNNLPVFFIRDSIQFPDVIHSLKPSPDTNTPDLNRQWDFFTNTPESTHMLMWLYSDRGTIKSYRKMEGFGVNTYIWVNDKGERNLIKYHWKPMLGIETIDRKEAEILAGTDPDIAINDLYDTLKSGETVEFELCVQIMKPKYENALDFDPLDDTKVWPEDKFPLMKVGKMTIDKAPDNFFAEVEQAAFCPGNIVPGIELSADKMLQGRGFAYSDAHRYRIGANFEQLPVNRPIVPVNNNNQDGPMRYYADKGKVNYYPNTLNDGQPEEDKSLPEPEEYVAGRIQKRSIMLKNDFKQAGEHYEKMNELEKRHLIDNIASELWQVDEEIVLKAIKNFAKASSEMAHRLAKALDIVEKC